MAKKNENNFCCVPGGKGAGGFKVESVVSVDERGQMVLPKEIRDKANIRAGDKLALVTLGKDDQVCCLLMIKADELTQMVRGMLGPLVKDIL